MLRPFKVFVSIDSASRRLFMHAWYLLGISRWRALHHPFKDLVRELQVHHGAVSSPDLSLSQQEESQRISLAVQRASRYTPWNSNCLAQVLAAQQLLFKKHIAGVFYLGADPGAVDDPERDLSAHAWLIAGGRFITGEQGHQRYTVVSSFSWQQSEERL